MFDWVLNVSLKYCNKGELCAAQKMKFSFKDFFSKYDQKRNFLWIWSDLQKKS